MNSGVGSGVAILIPVLKITSTDYVALVLDADECLVLCLVYQSPNLLADSLLSLLEATTEWTLDFNIHVDEAAASIQASDLDILSENIRT